MVQINGIQPNNQFLMIKSLKYFFLRKDDFLKNMLPLSLSLLFLCFSLSHTFIAFSLTHLYRFLSILSLYLFLSLFSLSLFSLSLSLSFWLFTSFLSFSLNIYLSLLLSLTFLCHFSVKIYFYMPLSVLL